MLLGFRDTAEARARLSGKDVAAYLRSKQKLLDLLPTNDRILLQFGATGDRSIREIGKLIGSNPGGMSRRMRVLWARLHDPLVEHLTCKSCPLSREMKQMGVELRLLGMRPTEIAEKHGMSVPETHRMLAFLKGYARGLGIVVDPEFASEEAAVG